MQLVDWLTAQDETHTTELKTVGYVYATARETIATGEANARETNQRQVLLRSQWDGAYIVASRPLVNLAICQRNLLATKGKNDLLNVPASNGSPKSRLGARVLCRVDGVLGIHRFYAGRVLTGILELLTLGWCGIGVVYGFVIIGCRVFKDTDGRRVTRWT